MTSLAYGASELREIMLTDFAVELASGPNFGVLATMLPDGSPQVHLMWVDTDGEDILLNTEIHRQKFKNLQRNSRATVMIFDREDPYRFVEVRGRVSATIRGGEARDHIDRLAKKYQGLDEYPGEIQSERVILRLSPDKVVEKG